MSKPNTPFIKHPHEYERVTDVLEPARLQAAKYLQLMTGDPIETCLAFVEKETGKTGQFAPKPLELQATYRNPETQDRRAVTITIDKVVTSAHKAKSIVSPNLVVYDNPEKNKSFIGEAIDEDMARRAEIKKEAILAQQEKNERLMLNLTNEESGIKLGLNGISGAHTSPHNVLFNKTCHSSLTSTCRVITSLSNASTEKMISGNRHYFSPEVLEDNILSTLTLTEMDKVQLSMDKWGLHYPTVEDTIAVIKRSTDLYWKRPSLPENIIHMLVNMTPLERAAFVYVGDFYHLRVFNPTVVRLMIDDIMTPYTGEIEDPAKVVKEAEADYIALNGFLCTDLLAGRSYRKMLEESPENELLYAQSLMGVVKALEKYDDILDSMWRTDNIPSRVYSFPVSLRRGVVGSDTDSTMFTCQEWVEWYYGELRFDTESIKVSNIVCFINIQVSAHWFAKVSKQMGIVDENLYRLIMKNEYAFLVYLRANIAKTYSTLMIGREGNIFSEPHVQISGVQLKDSKLAPAIMKDLANQLKETMINLTKNGKIEIAPLLLRVASLERLIMGSLERRETKLLSFVNIRNPEAYLAPESNPRCQAHELWKECFSLKYGAAPEPPYRGVKISTTIANKTDTQRFITTLPAELQAPFRQWMERYNKDVVRTFYIPLEILENGFPEEFLPVLDIRRTAKELMNGYYIFLEMLGFYFRNKDNSHFVSDGILLTDEEIEDDLKLLT